MTRCGYVMATYAALLAVGVASCVPVPVKLIWNASASTPIGLYDLAAPHDLKRGDLVVVTPEKPLADFIVARGYIGRGVPLLKHVAALPGQSVCRTGPIVTIDAAFAGVALERDSRGRALPAWQGCRRIADGEVFLMNTAVADSLDGRYFGALPARDIIGKATPLYTDEAGNGRFVWRAAAH